MQRNFWLERWEKNDIGFHKTGAHHFLQRFFNLLQVQAGDPIFVPLCGKSLDLVWLHERGLEVTGVELSRLAIEAFCTEHGLTGEWVDADGMSFYRDSGYKLFCGDFFSLEVDPLGEVRSVYDRGSLVALPYAMRRRYAARLAALLPSASRVLLISYDYDQGEAYGPPFAVTRVEIEALFGDEFMVELLVEEDVLHSHQRLAERGVTHLQEFAMLLIRR